MRTFVALLSAGVLLAAAGASQAGGGPRLSLSVSTLKVLYHHPVTLSGRLSSHQAGRSIEILAQPYGSSSPKIVATVKTSAGGYWSQRLRPSILTEYQARSGLVLSRTLSVGVQPALGVVEAGDGRIWALARSDRHFTNKEIQLQQRTAAGAWQTIAKEPLGRFSTAVFAPRPTRATIRVAFSTNEAGAGYLGGTSHPLVYKAYEVTLVPSTFKVLYGNTVTLSGALRSALPGQRISIEAWPYGRSAPIHLATVKTGVTGSWSYRAKPRTGTSYQAHWSKTEASARVHVGVMPVVTLRELASGNVWTHVDAGRSLAGQKVKLQQRMSGGLWKTVMQMHLNKHSSVVFPILLHDSTIRVAMSVNQAGPGLLGATSHIFAYHAT
jgi:hypothetical protein